MTTTSANIALVAASLTGEESEIKYRTLTDKEEECVLDAVRILHGVFASADRGKSKTTLPIWAECGLESYENVLDRTFSGLKRKASADAARVIARAKLGVMSAIDAARDAEAIAAAEWDNLSPTLKARFPYTAPKSVKVPVCDVLAHFPKGWTVPQAAKVLSDVGYVIGVPDLPHVPGKKGAPGKNPNGAYIVADRAPASTVTEGSTLPHGNGERVELSSGQAIAAAK